MIGSILRNNKLNRQNDLQTESCFKLWRERETFQQKMTLYIQDLVLLPHVQILSRSLYLAGLWNV